MDAARKFSEYLGQFKIETQTSQLLKKQSLPTNCSFLAQIHNTLE